MNCKECKNKLEIAPIRNLDYYWCNTCKVISNIPSAKEQAKKELQTNSNDEIVYTWGISKNEKDTSIEQNTEPIA